MGPFIFLFFIIFYFFHETPSCFFDTQHDATEARLQNWGAFRQSMHFLRFSPWKYPEKVSRRDATCVRTPIPSKIGVRAGGGHSHAHAKVGCVSSMLAHSHSTNLRCRSGVTCVK